MDHFLITLLLTEQCNLRCRYCYETHEYGPSSAREFARILLFLERIARQYARVHVAFFGGEPMLEPARIREVMAAGKGWPAEASFSMTTNGTLLTPEILGQLAASGLAKVQVTLDGLEHAHDRARATKSGRGTFKTIYANLLGYREVEGDCAIVARVNASPQNRADIVPLAALLAEDFSSDKRFKSFLRRVGKWGGPNDEGLDTLGKDAFKDLEERFYARLPGAMRHNASEDGICYAAMPNHLLVFPDGGLGKCTVGLHDSRNRVGRIMDDGRLDVDQEKYAFWSRGFATQDPRDLSCPYGL